MAKCILVDDNELQFQENEGNCLLISEFNIFAQERDVELKLLATLLERMDRLKDVRPFLGSLS